MQNRYSMEEVPRGNFSEIVESHLKTSGEELTRDLPPLSQSCEKITEVDQEDCSLIVDETPKATS